MAVELTGSGLTIPDVVAVARNHGEVTIADAARQRVRRARERLEERVAAGEVIYGVNTGFGALVDEEIPADEVEALQENLVRSHAVGVGDPLTEEEVRAMLLLRLNSLLVGNSGVRERVVLALRDALNGGLYPRVPRTGSVSASGDLAPLAHVALVLTGEGEARVDGEWVDGGEALAAAGIEPLTLQAKEGLALVNGTNLVAGLGALAVHDARTLADAADAVGALSLEAAKGIRDAFRREVHDLRGQPGQQESAANVREQIAGSDLVRPSVEADGVQDAYSLRCIPQVHGATRDAIDHAADVVERELNAVTDNPLVLDDGDVVSGGNFHGQPVALALDSLATAVAELASIAERRVFRLLGGDDDLAVEDYLREHLEAVAEGEREPEEALGAMREQVEAVADGDTSVEAAVDAFEDEAYGPDRLPRFLVDGRGRNSGLMMPQVTAAALVSENKTLAHPDVVDSIPTSDNQEDHVSMGANAANHLAQILENTRRVLGIEAFAAYQALSFREGEPGEGSQRVLEQLDDGVAPVERDRVMLEDLESATEVIGEELLSAS